MTTLRLILLCLVLVLAIAAVYAGPATVAVLAIWLLDGAIAFLWTAAGIGMGLGLLRLLRVQSEGTLRFASAGGLGLGVLALLVLGLGLAGWLSRPAAIVLVAVGLCGWLPLLRVLDTASIRAAMQKRPVGWAIWLVPALLLGLALVAVTIPPGILWNKLGDPNAYDVLEYHLQIPREWYELGRIVPLKHNVFSYFPFAMEMHFLAAMHLSGGPWAGMYAAQFMVLAHMVLAAMAVHGATVAALVHRGGPRGPHAPRSALAATEQDCAVVRQVAATVAVAALVATPWTILLGTIAYNEAGLILYAALAIAWTVRPGGSCFRTTAAAEDCASPKSMAASQWIVAGAFAGLACGCKYTGAPMLLILWPLALLAAGKWRAGTLKRILTYFVVGIAVFSPWLVRNLAWTGNPVFPEAMRLLGRAHFSENQVERWEAEHSAHAGQRSAPARLKAFWREVVVDGRYGYVLWPMAAGAAVCLWPRREARSLAIFIVLLAVFWMGLTHLQSRFFAVAVVPAALMVGMLCASTSGRRWALGAVAVLPFLPSPFIVDRNRPDEHGYPAPLIHQGLWPAAQLQAFGLGNLSHADQAIQTRCESGKKLALIGDAKAFLYVMPMANLRYRTVFDVDQRPGQDIVDAWLGPDAAAIRRECQIVIDYGELRRFSDTYRHITLPTPPGPASPTARP
ncbi:MAG: hypothetical protein ACHRHE_15100 [Tepidisphaerales bacterium]